MIHISEQSAALLQALEGAAQVGAYRQAFVSQAEGIDWAAQTPDDLAYAIDLALRLELGTLAISLAQQGGQLFPGPRTPPAGGVSPRAARHSRHDLRLRFRASKSSRICRTPNHANAYRGQWVAVREGALLSAAASLKGLLAALGPNHDRTNHDCHASPCRCPHFPRCSPAALRLGWRTTLSPLPRTV